MSSHGDATFPDGACVPFSEAVGPVVTVRFADGGQADFRPGNCHPGSAHVRYDGYVVQGLRVDVWADVDPDGKVWASSVWKTDVAGIDGGNVIPEKVRDQVTAMLRKRARDARAALRAAASGRQAA